MATVTSTKELRQFNKKRVVEALRNQDACTKTEVAAELGLSFSTVSNICNGLIAENLLLAKESGLNSGGRSPYLLHLNPDGRGTLCLDFTNPNRVGVAFVNLHNRILARETLSFTGMPRSFPELSDLIKLTSTRLLQEIHLSERALLGTGAVIPGVYSNHQRIVTNCTNPWIEGLDLKAILAEIFPYPVVWVENDANLAAIGASLFARTSPTVLFIYIGQGIGLGIVHKGKIFQGARGFAGEIGHIPLGDPTLKCYCGNTGCLEGILSVPGILRRYQKNRGAPSGDLDRKEVKDFLAAVSRGGRMITGLAEEVGLLIGKAASIMANIIDPEAIYVGGELLPFLKLAFPSATAEFARRVLLTEARSISLRLAEATEDLLYAGCAETVFQHWIPE